LPHARRSDGAGASSSLLRGLHFAKVTNGQNEDWGAFQASPGHPAIPGLGRDCPFSWNMARVPFPTRWITRSAL